MMALLASSVAFASSKEATVITYPGPLTEKVFCQYCGTQLVEEKPVNNYQTTNQYNTTYFKHILWHFDYTHQ